MTKKLQDLTLALVAMFVFSVVIAQAAPAELTLLAEWLVNGSAVTLSENSTIAGSLKLEDRETIAGKSSVNCSLVMDGIVGQDGTGEITEILSLGGVAISAIRPLLGTGGGTECVTGAGCSEGTLSSPIEVTPLGLPWLTELVLTEIGTFRDIIFARTVGYKILCLVLGFNTVDECTRAEVATLVQNSAVTGDASTPSGSKFAPESSCTQSGGKATGVNETTEESTMTAGIGELLTVSSV